ncbi:acyltransferase family protein [Pseudoclavibacter sp. AY1H1]|uniref:acyltransferase family protein n=1 Tax=Pseudoclavibacter sp. AY1H1 TaxID=2080584 RepID=UPI000CE7B1BD|nr:acyltransferase family protein [Pseudoclavibacter sp. AY1H1]PPF34313.1 hypothetical protein C5E05_15555 [Pseudoclavibacter sp. AY1H1]
MTAPPTAHTRRGDLNGLRAVAVLLVVANHLTVSPVGGFIGVDVFYVLSGFLISGILIREYQRTGSISFQHFYIRRVKRILPVATLVLLVTVAVAFLVWFPTRANQTVLDALAALFFVSNWHFVRLGTDYLQATGPVSPLQHYWSLAVEEQFYVVWPIALLMVASLATKRGRKIVRPLLWFMVAATALSFAWALYSSRAMPEFAYFDTISRVWELGLGAIAALLLPFAKISHGVGRLLAYAGVTLIVVGAFVITPEWPFPGPWAVVPVAGSLLILAGGAQGRGIVLLDNAVARYIGRISYSLYLWHFPVIVFLHSVDSANSVVMGIAAVFMMFGLSILSYHFIELPIINSSWLKSHTSARRSRQLIGAIAVGVFVLGMSAVQLRGPYSLVAAGGDSSTGASVAEATIAPGWDSAAALSARVDESLRTNTWPEIDLGSLDESLATPGMDTEVGCRNSVSSSEALVCERAASGGETRTAVVVVDSVAISWIPAVEQALPGWRVLGFGYAACPAVLAPVGSGERGEQCAAAQQRMLDFVAAEAPDLVLTSSAQSSLAGLSSGARADAALDEWQLGVEAFTTEAAASGAQVVVIGNPPAGLNPQECVTRATGPLACTSSLQESTLAKAQAEASAVDAAGGRYVDVIDWFCSHGSCPMLIDDTVLRYDGAHLTNDASASFGRVLAESLQ